MAEPGSFPRLVCPSEPARCAGSSSQQTSRGPSGISSQLGVNGSHSTSQQHFEDDLALKKDWFPQLQWGRGDCGNDCVRTGDSWAEGPWARRLRFHTIPKTSFSGPTGHGEQNRPIFSLPWPLSPACGHNSVLPVLWLTQSFHHIDSHRESSVPSTETLWNFKFHVLVPFLSNTH